MRFIVLGYPGERRRKSVPGIEQVAMWMSAHGHERWQRRRTSWMDLGDKASKSQDLATEQRQGGRYGRTLYRNEDFWASGGSSRRT